MTDQPSSHRTGAMNPWDSQSARIYPETEPWHSLNANENGGQSRDAVLAFAQNQRDEVRSLGEAAGSLAAEPGMKQQTFIKTGGGQCPLSRLPEWDGECRDQWDAAGKGVWNEPEP